ncbi:cold-shock protein [Aquabacterium sp. NJ1]|uniref:cold-shock protein n=1 Tax=Aquabacterium sp. NJ1 TaxID=1538295 RepID=UPI00052C25D6|nr:cold-shock protein [Aquabacterium sp. NJ1]KGM38725.1 cold-shock protein [Aquabacterium sp. NJ1]
MKIGQVKWFNDAKGYGFIVADGEDTDVFVHFSQIVMDGFRTLKEGMRVQFEPQQHDRGVMALQVQVLDDAINAIN